MTDTILRGKVLPEVMHLWIPTNLHTSRHSIGGCYYSHEHQTKWINVPKNASSTLKEVFGTALGWPRGNYLNDPTLASYKTIVVLRDPIERWISAIVQYGFHTSLISADDLRDVDSSLVRYMFTNINFDTHTAKQRTYLFNLDLQNTTFFKMETPDLVKDVTSYLMQQGIMSEPVTVHSRNVTTDERAKDESMALIREAIKKESYMANIKKFYSDDFELISSVKFANQ
jgi:hypothetical protein